MVRWRARIRWESVSRADLGSLGRSVRSGHRSSHRKSSFVLATIVVRLQQCDWPFESSERIGLNVSSH